MTISSDSKSKIRSPEPSRSIRPLRQWIIELETIKSWNFCIIDKNFLMTSSFLIFFMVLDNFIPLNPLLPFLFERRFLCRNRIIISVLHHYESGSGIFNSNFFCSISNWFLLFCHDFDDFFPSLNRPDVLCTIFKLSFAFCSKTSFVL